jgi:DNA invertase Pin-like site-specific DNA recombinase
LASIRASGSVVMRCSRERTRAGLEAARTRGRVEGRRSVINQRKLRAALAMRKIGEMTKCEIAASSG